MVRPSPVWLVALVTLAAGVAILARPATPRADQTVWTFAQTHADALRSPDADGLTPLDVYERRTGRSVAVRVLGVRAMDLRLTALSRAGDADALPDVAQLEVGQAAKYLDRTVADVPFRPLDVPAGVLASRLATWQRDGITFGLPVDVHPVALAYRADLWAEAGLDPTAAATWPALADLMRRYVAHHGGGGTEVAALEFNRNGGDHLVLLLRQRDLDPATLDEADPRVIETVEFAAGLLAEGIARPTARGHGRWAAEFEAGDVGMLWLADWRAAYLVAGAPGLAGRVGLMPLPRFEASDAPTATWGGTAMFVPAAVAGPAAAELASFLAYDPSVLAARRRTTSVLPPLPGAWEDDGEEDGYFTTPPRRVFADLAAVAPPAAMSTRAAVVTARLTRLLQRAAARLEARGAG